jgi:hypothetical protein
MRVTLFYITAQVMTCDCVDINLYSIRVGFLKKGERERGLNNHLRLI